MSLKVQDVSVEHNCRLWKNSNGIIINLSQTECDVLIILLYEMVAQINEK